MLGTVGGALVVPTAAASLDMPVELVVEAFAVVVIGGLGSMRGALVGALIVGLMRALAISFYAELEMLAIYLVVIARADRAAGRAVREADRMTRARPAQSRRSRVAIVARDRGCSPRSRTSPRPTT